MWPWQFLKMLKLWTSLCPPTECPQVVNPFQIEQYVWTLGFDMTGKLEQMICSSGEKHLGEKTITKNQNNKLNHIVLD